MSGSYAGNCLILLGVLELKSDAEEVSQGELLNLVRERLLDSISNIKNKRAAHVKKRQRKIAAARELMPRLATGLDVNIKNKRAAHVKKRQRKIGDALNLLPRLVTGLDVNIKNKSAAHVKKRQQKIGDALNLLPRLATGLDVNINFYSIQGFEPPSECGIFDLLNIPLYHGCIVAPEDHDMPWEIGSKSYDDLLNELVVVQDQMTPEQRNICQKFVESKASVTNYGLFCLQEGLKERELCVLFHNGHFSTMFKVNGDNMFVTSNFKECKMVSRTNDTWDEHNAMASTDDYLGNIDSAALGGSDMKFDLEEAIALQRIYDQQPPKRNNV